MAHAYTHWHQEENTTDGKQLWHNWRDFLDEETENEVPDIEATENFGASVCGKEVQGLTGKVFDAYVEIEDLCPDCARAANLIP